jgi:hypothetical protein
MNNGMGMGHMARIGDSRDTRRALVREPEGKRRLERPRRSWEYNINAYLEEFGWKGVNCFDLVEDVDKLGLL